MPRVSRVSAVEAAIEEIRAQIREGHWVPGDRLPSEAELTEILGISRAPLREAIRALVHAGLLSVRQGDGTYVVAVDESAVAFSRKLKDSKTRDVLEVRRGLDATAVHLAAARRTDDDLTAMEATLRRRREAASTGDQARFVDADVAFHLAVAQAAHNALLLGLYEGLSMSIRESLNTIESLQHAVGEGGDDHEALFDAIKSGDEARAVDIALSIIASQEQQCALK
ncbi:FadR family transcriptional regulator [Micromonospora sp. DR5-3]|uniref:FadR/GntR family transcriptional regulator n=1 Tax=unclassified Micromonospora TaxID=2617518 RepID=UPI0011D9E361|nr:MULTISPECIES: FadR/GntR family transcriptional regulator [unclassified Micromonospora]MCW3818779.1 FadR family transcriptional regulator [Micromonospora sp. DR5-3]TYC21568.1 FadR family transcriptional regulator [Micromonospora sp. MP36]